MSMSLAQLKQLGIAASAAVAHQRGLGAFVMPPDMLKASKSAQNDFWRHQQVALATQRVCSFKDMVQDEYQPVMQHLEALAGPGYKTRAVNSTVRVVEDAACHRAPGCEYVRDMYFWLSKAGYKEGYAIAIMKNKFGGITDLRLLREYQLKQLHDTVVNRCRAKLGVGDADSRNKKERGISSPQKDAKSEPQKPASSIQHPEPSISPANGSPPPVSKAREYVLRPRSSNASIPRDNIPF